MSRLFIFNIVKGPTNIKDIILYLEKVIKINVYKIKFPENEVSNCIYMFMAVLIINNTIICMVPKLELFNDTQVKTQIINFKFSIYNFIYLIDIPI